MDERDIDEVLNHSINRHVHGVKNGICVYYMYACACTCCVHVCTRTRVCVWVCMHACVCMCVVVIESKKTSQLIMSKNHAIISELAK